MNNQSPQPVFTITDNEQVKLLADPLKLRLLTAFAEAPKTTKQVAKEIGESLTKLYRHVDALHNAGLLVVCAETQRRGFVERTYQAVARRFEVDRSLFGLGRDIESGTDETMRSLLRGAENEIINAIEICDEDSKPLVARLRVRLTAEQAISLKKVLSDWIESCNDFDEVDGDDAVETYGAMIAFYLLDE